MREALESPGLLKRGAIRRRSGRQPDQACAGFIAEDAIHDAQGIDPEQLARRWGDLHDIDDDAGKAWVGEPALPFEEQAGLADLAGPDDGEPFRRASPHPREQRVQARELGLAIVELVVGGWNAGMERHAAIPVARLHT